VFFLVWFGWLWWWFFIRFFLALWLLVVAWVSVLFLVVVCGLYRLCISFYIFCWLVVSSHSFAVLFCWCGFQPLIFLPLFFFFFFAPFFRLPLAVGLFLYFLCYDLQAFIYKHYRQSIFTV
jgi:hypothetical protein